MQNFNIVRKSEVDQTFKVKAVQGRFDLPSGIITEEFTGSFDIPEEWSIGAIVGNSGTGKTTIMNELFDKFKVKAVRYKKTKAIIDEMPKEKTVEEITKAFNSVGFSSPPSWLKPYHVLSNGEKMRVDLARCLLLNQEKIIFDEFTSVVDRTVAKVGSLAVQKAIRKTDKKFIAVTCHHDVIEWLQPDWIFDTNTMSFSTIEKKNLNFRLKYSIQQINQSGKFLGNITI